ncbi:MAG: Tetratricopeptide (TPR) repeat [Verrucomicrobia bacterium]|nr:MAG: Tetratricopeptide (TPR) repeat [Verrucomicrobiota bacterium]
MFLFFSQACCLFAEEVRQEPAYIAEVSDRRLLVDAFDSDAWEALVSSRTELKDYVRAREALQIWRRNMAKKGRKIPKIELLEAVLENAQGNHSAAINARLRFLEHEAKNVQVWTELFSQTTNLREAAGASEIAVKVLSAKQLSSVWNAVVELGIKRSDLPYAGTALEFWRRGLLKLKADSPQLDHLQGDVDWIEERPWEAVQAWNRSLQGDSKNALLLEKLFRAHDNMGSVSEAMEVITRLIKIKETAPNYCRRANLYILKREWKDARSDVLKANKIDAASDAAKRLYPVFEGFESWYPSLRSLDDRVQKAQGPGAIAAALLERTRLFVYLGLYSAAYDDAAEALKVNPSSVVAMLWLGACSNQEGRAPSSSGVQGNAEALFKQAEALRSLDDLPLPQKVQRLIDLGQAQFAREFARQSEKNAQAEGKPGREMVAVLLESDVKMYEAAHRTTDVRFGKALERLVELEPDRADLWISLGKHQLAQGQLDQALESAVKAEAKGAGDRARLLIKAVGERRILP